MSVFETGDPAVRAIYDRLLICVRRLGRVVAEENNTRSISRAELRSRAPSAEDQS